jgi:hypothetical protein
MTETLMAGIDLHSNNLMIGIVDQDGRRVKHQKLECELKEMEGFLKPYWGQALLSAYFRLRWQGYALPMLEPRMAKETRITADEARQRAAHFVARK